MLTWFPRRWIWPMSNVGSLEGCFLFGLGVAIWKSPIPLEPVAVTGCYSYPPSSTIDEGLVVALILSFSLVRVAK